MRTKPHWIIVYETLGFMCVAALSWFNELVDVPGILYGSPKKALDLRESLIESTVTIIVWLVVVLFTMRLLRRIRTLEHMMKVCTGCQKVFTNGKWLSFDTYSRQVSDTVAVAGDLCPECAARIKDDLQTVKNNLMQMKR